MVIPQRRKSVYFFTALGSCLVVAAIALNVSWGMILNWRTSLLFFFGFLFFLIIIAGVVLNTIFLVREIKRNEQHDAFMNAVTHELKTPVASIRLYLETLQKRELDEAKRQEFYQIMLSDSDRLISTIDQVLNAARTSTSNATQSRSRLDLGALVEEIIRLARTRHHLAAEHVQYATAFGDHERPQVVGDADELKAAISNLVDNAIKYSGADVQVQVKLDRVPGRPAVAVRVSDAGPGIAPTELKRIFKRFYRIPGSVSARIKGTGIGLFIVRSVARRHGGRAYAQSSGVGQGSTFTLELPLPPERPRAI
ncbi:MAG: HAMP domain-containing histidine kinase [Bryobacteraceae bacterium]|nr:HAMP domain-containing histidine kinase [Bryobacteraceae bacterium]